MFDPVDPRQSFPALERGILKYWQEEDTFKRSIRQRSLPYGDRLDGPTIGTREEAFSFYDGPPFATGLPHYGHLLAGTIKDVIPRYQTMRGKKVQRRFGWDCHGLPIENLVEKENDLGSKKDIETMGVKAFNALCRQAVQRYTKEWRVTVERMGRWVDMDWDYRTMDPEYMESIWWVFKSLADKKLIYEGHKPMHICPRCQTVLSNFEVTQGYKDITDQSAYAMFALRDARPCRPQETEAERRSSRRATGSAPQDDNCYMLAWTTTPWTLPGNLFLAVHPKTHYVTVAADGKRYIVAKERVEDVFKGLEHVVEGGERTGKTLVGMRYKPLFPYFVENYEDNAFRVVSSDFVTTADGTGIVHIAPGFGEDDFDVGKREKAPLLQHVGMDGKFTKDVTDFAGMDVKPKDDPTKADQKIAEWLKAHGLLLRTEKYKHSYPHCWRCDSPLLNYATSSWFVSVEKIKEKMLLSNKKTEWVPAHIRDGRFGKWLEGARDWAVSRNRYWGTPLPIWRAGKDIEVIGSREDLMAKKPFRFTRVTVMRHGESEGNLIPKYQGVEPGTDLSDQGKRQAAAAGELLREESVSRIYASPLARTLQTAQHVADATGAEVAAEPRLREVAFGEYEGKTIDFTDLAFVKARRARKLESGKVESIYHFPGMETWSQVQARLQPCLQELLERHRGEHIVLVTHADPLLGIKHFFGKEDPAKLCNQPYPGFAEPHTFYWDHDAQAEMDLHKETVDEIAWPGPPSASSVDATFVRHGETDWNAAGKVQGGNVDEPLNDAGRAQALALAQTMKKQLKKQAFDGIVTSDLQRAAQTAQILAKELGLKIVEETPILRERNLGEWKNWTVAEVLEKHPYLSPDVKTTTLHYKTPPGGESLTAFLSRLEKASRHLLAAYAGKKMLVVGHAGVIRGMRVLMNQASYASGATEKIDNAAAISVPLHPWMRRIPEVLDCWFESGSMPYAQSHFPFDKRVLDLSGGKSQKKTDAELPPGFPADFIAEGIDQTRGWFYTLMVLSSALFRKPAFEHCIVNGTVLAEDGKKMSKRLKNYPEPLEIVEKYGADAVRFALMSSPAVRGEDLRFSAKYAEETLRGVLLPLWNTYAFFVTYANAAKWQPQETRRHSAHPLDQWIRAETQDLVNRMTEQLDGYDLSATCDELADSIDALTNWYVRLSRRRFAGKGELHGDGADANEEERAAAIGTLYDVLLTLSQLLSPFCPFITEDLYLNLVAEEHGSIHLTDWPQTRKLSKSEKQLLRQNRLLRQIVSLGLKVRADKKIKTRQPLAKATVAVPVALLGGEGLGSSEFALLREEMNVKTIEIVHDPGAIAEPYVQVDARKAGPRLGGRVQEIIQAGKRGDFAIRDDGTILILEEVLLPEEGAVIYRGKGGADVAADRGVVVSLDTRVTPELELEGKARDLIRAIQKLRKDAGYDVSDKLAIGIAGADDILAMHTDMIAQETNVTVGSAEGEKHEVDLDGRAVTIILSDKK